MTPRAPRSIVRDATAGLTITWTDGQVVRLTTELLRRNCPCAECREKRGDERHGRPLTGKAEPDMPRRSSLLRVIESSKSQALHLDKIWGVGQYALGMSWADGHDTGIYTFDYLSELAYRSRPESAAVQEAQ